MGVDASASSKVPILQTTISFPSSCWACSFLPYRVPYSYPINDAPSRRLPDPSVRKITTSVRYLTQARKVRYHIDICLVPFPSVPETPYFKFFRHVFSLESSPPPASSRLCLFENISFFPFRITCSLSACLQLRASVGQTPRLVPTDASSHLHFSYRYVPKPT